MEKYLINPNRKYCKINRDICGMFSEHLGRCIYEGVFVGEDSPIPNVKGMRCDVVNALKDMGLPVLRWPGGCFADEYHWKDGIGNDRKKMINTHWGGVVEDNSFGTHEFFELCSQLGCEAYITGNVGSGTVREMSEWVEYMTFDGLSPMSELRRKNGREKPWKIKYFGVGNENWGCGGHMLPDYYTDLYRQYETYIRDYAGNDHITRIACGPCDYHYEWTETLMKKACSRLEGLSLHYYTHPRQDDHFRGKATVFSDKEYIETVSQAYNIEEIITRNCEIMNRYDPEKKVALIVDEWGTWYDVEEGTNPGFLYQQNTMRDAVVAGLSLNVFNKHADRVKMANLAQTVNVLQAVALTDGEKMVLTPTYFVFKMFKDHADNTLVDSFVTSDFLASENKTPKIVESASVKNDGTVVATLVNTTLDEAIEIDCRLAHSKISFVEAEILTGGAREFNDFDNAQSVKTTKFSDFSLNCDGFVATLPPCSVVKFLIK